MITSSSIHAMHTVEIEIMSVDGNKPRRKVIFKADGGFCFWRGGDFCALRCNSNNRFPEPTAARVQGYGGMLEVDLGDPVCPLPV